MNPTARESARQRRQWALVAWVVLLLGLPSVAGPGEPNAEVLPQGTAVHSQPAATTEVLKQLPGGTRVEVVFTLRGSGGEWSQILLPSGDTGYVPDRTLRHLKPPQRWRSVETPSSAFEIPLKRGGGIYFVPVRINGQATAFFAVDTGAASVLLSEDFARSLGIEYTDKPRQTMHTANGETQAYLIRLDSLHIPDESGIGLAGVDAAVSKLPGFPPEIGGLLGQSFLRRFRITIDATREVMRLEQASEPPPESRDRRTPR